MVQKDLLSLQNALSQKLGFSFPLLRKWFGALNPLALVSLSSLFSQGYSLLVLPEWIKQELSRSVSTL